MSADGVYVARGALPAEAVGAWARAADAAYADPTCHAAHGLVPTASSMRLSALPLMAIVAAVHGALGPALRARLGGPVAVNLDQAWLRRQYPAGLAPAQHHPHGWHQDGALGHDFLHGDPADGLVPLCTVWAPLTPCGERAPGLEWVPGRWPLRGLAGLAPAAMDADHPTRLSARLAPGDALLFSGDVLHRTLRRPGMDRVRTSVELRWALAAAIPARLAGQRWHPLVA